MSNERPKMSVLQLVCFAIGIFIGMMAMRFVFGLDGILGGALGGGLGAALGMAIFALINKGK